MAVGFTTTCAINAFMVQVMFIVEDPIMTVKCRTAIKVLFI
jgi:hypothetical protein